MLPRTEADERQKNQEEKLEAHRKEIAELRTKVDEFRVMGAVMDPIRNKSQEDFEAMKGTKAQGINVSILAIGFVLTMLISIISLILQFIKP